MKKKSNILYIVIMRRWGNQNAHSYFVGAYSTKTKAIKNATKEELYRGGGKYIAEILEIEKDYPYVEEASFSYKYIQGADNPIVTDKEVEHYNNSIILIKENKNENNL